MILKARGTWVKVIFNLLRALRGKKNINISENSDHLQNNKSLNSLLIFVSFYLTCKENYHLISTCNYAGVT